MRGPVGRIRGRAKGQTQDLEHSRAARAYRCRLPGSGGVAMLSPHIHPSLLLVRARHGMHGALDFEPLVEFDQMGGLAG